MALFCTPERLPFREKDFFVLRSDKKVCIRWFMFVTDLSYVRQQLQRCSPEEMNAIAKAIRVHEKTVRRISDKRTLAPRSDTVGKLVMYFRTKEARSQ